MSLTLTRRQLLEAGFTTRRSARPACRSRSSPRRPRAGPGTRASAASAASAAASRSPPQDDRVVAVKGDPASPVNRGLLCVKGYANAADPLRRGPSHAAAAAHEGRQVRQAGRLRAGDLGARLRRDEARVDARPRASSARPGSRSWARASTRSRRGTRRSKLVKAGWRSNNLDPNARHCMASAVAAFMQTFGIDEPAGLLRRHRAHRHGRDLGRQHGRDAPHALGAHRRRAAARGPATGSST